MSFKPLYRPATDKERELTGAHYVRWTDGLLLGKDQYPLYENGQQRFIDKEVSDESK